MMTFLGIPKLGSVEMTHEDVCAVGPLGNRLHHFNTYASLTSDVSFEAVTDHSGALCSIQRLDDAS